MKKVMVLFLTGMMIFSCLGTAFAKEITVTVDGKQVEFTDAKPYVDGNGRTMVPLRPVADAMGIDVEWDSRTRTAVFSETYEKAWRALVTISMARLFMVKSCICP